jgi:hypothetical protein
MTTTKETRFSKIRVKLSKIQFPEMCPVCLEEPEDLVFVTIIERADDDYSSSSWMKEQDKTAVALNAALGATTFAIPTCMRHGSKGVRSLRTKLIAAIGFFVMFYPILFFLLQLNVAIGFSRPLIKPLVGLIVTVSIFVIILFYGLFPRALERAIRFHNLSRVRDSVLLSISNAEYREHFLDLNKMNVDVMFDETIGTKSQESGNFQ